jgi:hypothetical protein
MDPKAILLPVCGQVLLTLLVWIVLYITRIGTMKRKHIHPQVLANEAQAQALLNDVVNPSDNFENLFELPVLFYVAALVISTNGLTDPTYVLLAWSYVIFRSIHSLIHCSYNKIMHRFYAYLISSLILWGIWFRITWQILS